jgi:LTXXQ motif family protein
MFARKTCASMILALGLIAAPALAQQAVQPGHHPGGAKMGPGGAMMTPGGTMMTPGGTMMGPGGTMMGPGGAMMGDYGISGPMWRMMMGEGAVGGMGMMSALAGHVEGRLAFLKTELKITDAQKPLWDKFADAFRDNAKTMGQVMRGSTAGGGQSATLPDRLAKREKFLTARLDALHNLKAAVDPLYAALSADQKKTADEIMLAPIGMMM